jgi:hypothetical protein
MFKAVTKGVPKKKNQDPTKPKTMDVIDKTTPHTLRKILERESLISVQNAECLVHVTPC